MGRLITLTLLAGSSIILVNSLLMLRTATAMDSYETVVLLSTLRDAPRVANQLASTVDSASGVDVVIYSDFACRYCRESFSAIDSVRTLYGVSDSVTWQYRYWPDLGDPTSLRFSLEAACTLDSTGPWRLLGAISAEMASGDEWSRDLFDRALATLDLDLIQLEQCAKADSTMRRVLGDAFRAAALAIDHTPTVVVNGVSVAGRLEYTPFSQFIRDRLRRRRAATGRQ